MRRSMGLIQKILEWAEEHSNGDPIDPPRCTGLNPKIVHYHVGLCGEAGYLRVNKVSGAEEPYPRFSIGTLTWAGHEALARFRGEPPAC